MMVNSVITNGNEIFRILSIKEDEIFVINCKHRYMPYWIKIDKVKDFKLINEDELLLRTKRTFKKEEDLTNIERKEIQYKYGTISSILPVIENKILRTKMIEICKDNFSLSENTIRYRLYDYLVYNTSLVFLDKKEEKKKVLSNDEKNFRWALNKYYYNSIKLSFH